MTAPILLTTTTTDHVDVYRRTVEGAIDQVGRFVWAGGGDVAALLTLVADLDQQLGWTNGGASAAVSSGPDAVGRANALPSVTGPGAGTAVPTPDPAPSRTRTPSSITDDELVAALAAAGRPLSVSALVNAVTGRAHNRAVGGETRKRYRARLDRLVKAGKLERGVGAYGSEGYAIRTAPTPSRARKVPANDYRRRARPSRASQEAKRNTVEALLMQSDALNTAEVASRLDMTPSEARRHLDTLRQAGRVRVLGSRRPGQPTLWRASEPVVTHREAPSPAVDVPGPDNWSGLVPTTSVEASAALAAPAAPLAASSALENEQTEGDGGEGARQ